MMSRFRHGGLLAANIGEISSFGIAGHTVRREVSVVDGVRFYRYTANPGLHNEYGTFWGECSETLLKRVYKRLGII